MPRTSCREDSVVCCRSAVSLQSSCSERSALCHRSIVLPYRSSRAANVVRSAIVLSFCRIATVVQRTSRRDEYVIYCSSRVRLRPSCRERSAETILRSTIVLSFWRIAPAAVPLTQRRDESTLCRRSGVSILLSRQSFFTTGVSSR